MSKRLAWVIGVSDYEEAPLAKCVQDVREIRKSLIAANFLKEDIIFTQDPDLDKFEIDKTKFRGKLHTNLEMILFYFSGHGAAVSNEQFLIPAGSISGVKTSLKKKTFLLFDDLINDLLVEKQYDSIKKWIWLDACRENVYAEGDTISYSHVKLSEQTNVPPNTILFQGTYPKKFSFEGSPDTPSSFFTSALLKYLPEQGLKHTSLVTFCFTHLCSHLLIFIWTFIL